VITALGLPPEHAHASVRFTVGKDIRPDDIERLLTLLPPMIERLRAVSPLYREQVAA
jgi:cysteine desulfurase